MSEEQKDQKKDQSVRDLPAQKDVTGGDGSTSDITKGAVKLGGGGSNIDPPLDPFPNPRPIK